LVVRTWNVFHGNAFPAERKAYLEEMVRLASADRPEVLCLQEVPVWALERLGEWSGMTVYGEVAAPPRLGPAPLSAELGRRLTDLHHGVLRSAFSGQANAILSDSRLQSHARAALALNSASFRRAQARWLGLDLVARLAWAKEGRLCQAVRLELPDGRFVLVANMHATGLPDDRLPDAELLRAASFADGLSRPGEICILAGDFNVRAARSRTLADLTGPRWEFSEPRDGLDQVLVRGALVEAVERWPLERRRLGTRILSDHAPVEVRIE
jgi:endonuclease/exonuclease/phosphatase family metal-dependent hydrolase